jgi:BCD family chlorophyll transporter-like MFS transporter
MGVFGAAQGLAYGLGGFAGAWMSDFARGWFGSPASGYAAVFVVEAVLFVASAWLAATSATAVRGATLRARRSSGDALLGALR